MKKLFGFFALLLCTILLSCNNLFSDKTGDISFSFSADDAIQEANAYLARGANNDEQSDSSTKEEEIKHKRQMRTEIMKQIRQLKIKSIQDYYIKLME